jgi:hypothetical protein
MNLFGNRPADAAAEVWIDGLRTRYSAEVAPDPSPALEQTFAWGPRPAPARRSGPALLPSHSQTHRRVRIRVAAAVMALTLCTGGLAVAGALPDSLQNAIADLAQKVGVHLPQASTGTGSQVGGEPGTPGTDPNISPSGLPASGRSNATGRSSSTPTSVLPGVVAPGTGLVPSTRPPVTAPPISVPGLPVIDVPPIILPPITVPPIELPGLAPIIIPPMPPIDL